MNPLRLLLAIYARLEQPLLRFNYWADVCPAGAVTMVARER